MCSHKHIVMLHLPFNVACIHYRVHVYFVMPLGNFGEVYKGYYTKENETVEVAIKILPGKFNAKLPIAYKLKLHAYVYVCVCVCMHAHVCVCYNMASALPDI